MHTRINWRAKLEKTQDAKIVPVPPRMQKQIGAETMLIPKPLDVDATIRAIPRGQLATVADIRKRIAEDYHVDAVCPLTTGMFLRIAAEAAAQDMQMRRTPVTPYWRVVRDNGALFERFPGGTEIQAEMLKLEGHQIETPDKSRVPRVAGFVTGN